MYMYPVFTSNTAEVPSVNPTNVNTMPRNRSSSAASVTSTPPALITRGFQSLRRAHRRLSTSTPSSPIASQEEAVERPAHETTVASATTRPAAESDSGNSVRPRLRLVPNVGLSSRSFVFEIIDRELEPGVIYRIGRFSDRNVQPDRLSFKSKVVSRNHAELWTEHGKVYLRDIGSSSGTFLNRIRLSPPSHVSAPHEIRDGDAVQLGVDYQGGLEPIYRAVRIRVELNRQTQNPNNPFTRTAFQQLRSHLIGTNVPQSMATSPPQNELHVQPADLGLHREPTKVHEHSSDIVAAPDSPKQTPLTEMMSRMPTDMSRADIQECCICLYAIAPFQALFIAPCSHVFHFKCLRPIVFQNYPGFSCPLCRSYFDLEASVAVEVDEVLEAISAAKEVQERQQKQLLSPKPTSISPIDTVPELNEDEDEDENEQQQQDNRREEEEAVQSTAAVATETEQQDSLARHERLNTAESSLRPSSSNHSDISSQTEETDIIKTHLDESAVLTPTLPYVNAPDDENVDGAISASSSSSNLQAINMESSGHLRAGPRINRGEGLLSTTLVGSPIFDPSVLPRSTDSNA